MANTPGTGIGGSSGYTTPVIVALIAAFAFMLILVQYFPRIIIGLFLLVLLSVILARSSTITQLLSGV